MKQLLRDTEILDLKCQIRHFNINAYINLRQESKSPEGLYHPKHST